MSVLIAHVVFFAVILLLVFCGYAIKEKVRRRKEEILEAQNRIFSDVEWMEMIRIGSQREWRMYERWLADGWSPSLRKTLKTGPTHNWKKEGF